MIFMRPVIMRDRSMNNIVTGSKYDNIRNVQILADQAENYHAINDATVPPWEYSDIVLPSPFNDD
jgi:hypothetical protein